MKINRFDLTTIGEGSIRLSVPAGYRLNSAKSFDIGIAGAEANVAGGLARLGWNSGWISSLPKTPVGERIRNEYYDNGINVEKIHWSDTGRVATSYVEYAVPPRSSKVIYDRKNSCFANMEVADVDWDYFLNTRLIHLTGISIPLSKNTRMMIETAAKKAKEKEIPISFDVNYRSNLWTAEEAFKDIAPIVQGIELLFCSKADAIKVFHCSGSDEEIIYQLKEKTLAKNIVVSLSSEGVIALHGNELHRIPVTHVTIVDRIGAGDGLATGVIHGWLQGDFVKGLQYGSVTAALALSQYGEIINTNKNELEMLLQNRGKDIIR